MGRAIGIDLGTTNSCVAILDGDTPKVIANKEGYRTTPSVVSFMPDGTYKVGNLAKRQAAVNPKRTCFSIKRQMGSNFRLKIDGHDYSPQELSALILKKLKVDAEEYLGEEVTDAVITVPAYFDDAQRQATKVAGRIAGLNVLRIINEPTSAALAYGLDNAKEQKILVFDLGGGTFDISLIEIADGVIDVLSTSGDNFLGGDDFDERIVEIICREIKKLYGINVSKDPAVMCRIHEEAERAKKELSSSQCTKITLPYLTKVKDEVINFEMTLTRDEFNKSISDLIERIEIPIHNALIDSGVKKDEISKVLLVGGSTRIPLVQDKLRDILGIEPSRNVNPDECVAYGAAIQAGKLTGQITTGSTADSLVLMDVTPLSLSIETVGKISNVLIPRNTTIPVRHSQIFTTASNFQTSVDIKVFQGERRFTKDNRLLGNFRLSGIKRAFAGVPQIEVTFDIDVNGIVNVSARDLGTGKEQSITITSSSSLSEDEIQKAIWKAKMYEEGDDDKVNLLNEKKRADALINKAKIMMGEHRREIGRDTKKLIKQEIKAVSALNAKYTFGRNTEITDITAKAEELKNANNRLEMYITE